MTTQEAPMPMEDLVGLPLAGGGEIVTRLPVDELEQSLTLVESRGFDRGWVSATSYVESSVKQRIADAVAAAERQVHRDYRAARRHRRFENLCVFVIVAVMTIALYLITRP